MQLILRLCRHRTGHARAGPELTFENFDRRIIGLTGGRDAIQRFEREVGAGHSKAGSGFDHSTSLFLLDPMGPSGRDLIAAQAIRLGSLPIS